jgi:hypothetical protein
MSNWRPNKEHQEYFKEGKKM